MPLSSLTSPHVMEDDDTAPLLTAVPDTYLAAIPRNIVDIVSTMVARQPSASVTLLETCVVCRAYGCHVIAPYHTLHHRGFIVQKRGCNNWSHHENCTSLFVMINGRTIRPLGPEFQHIKQVVTSTTDDIIYNHNPYDWCKYKAASLVMDDLPRTKTVVETEYDHQRYADIWKLVGERPKYARFVSVHHMDADRHVVVMGWKGDDKNDAFATFVYNHAKKIVEVEISGRHTHVADCGTHWAVLTDAIVCIVDIYSKAGAWLTSVRCKNGGELFHKPRLLRSPQRGEFIITYHESSAWWDQDIKAAFFQITDS